MGCAARGTLGDDPTRFEARAYHCVAMSTLEGFQAQMGVQLAIDFPSSHPPGYYGTNPILKQPRLGTRNGVLIEPLGLQDTAAGLDAQSLCTGLLGTFKLLA